MTTIDRDRDRDRLRRLADAATPGPWENTRNGVQQSLAAATKVGDYKYEGVGIVPEEYVRQDDAEFIAAAREAVPALLDALTRAEAQSAIRGRAVAIYRKRAEEAEVAARWAHDRAYKADLSWEDEKRRADQAEASRDEWRQTALDERGAALDLLEQIKVRDRRIQAVQHLVDQADHAGNWTVTCTHLQRAIDQ